jgi:hypothetical protein
MSWAVSSAPWGLARWCMAVAPTPLGGGGTRTTASRQLSREVPGTRDPTTARDIRCLHGAVGLGSGWRRAGLQSPQRPNRATNCNWDLSGLLSLSVLPGASFPQVGLCIRQAQSSARHRLLLLSMSIRCYSVLFCSILAQAGLSVGKTGPNGPFSGKNWPKRAFQWEKLAQPGLSVGKTGPTGPFSGKNWPNRVFQWKKLAQPGLSVGKPGPTGSFSGTR